MEVGVDRQLDRAAADDRAASVPVPFRDLLTDLHTWYEEEGVLVLLLIFRGGGGADVANELPDRRSGGIETGETLGRCNAR